MQKDKPPITSNNYTETPQKNSRIQENYAKRITKLLYTKGKQTWLAEKGGLKTFGAQQCQQYYFVVYLVKNMFHNVMVPRYFHWSFTIQSQSLCILVNIF